MADDASANLGNQRHRQLPGIPQRRDDVLLGAAAVLGIDEGRSRYRMDLGRIRVGRASCPDLHELAMG
jgi:hypothetical protein